MNLSLWGIRYPLPAALVFVVLCIVGLWSLQKLPISALPDVQLPQVQVTINLPGATPSSLETDVTRRVEDAVASIPGIERMISAVNEGVSVTRVEFELGVNLDRVTDQVRDAVTRVRPDLPADIQEPSVARVDFIGQTLLAYMLQSDRLAPDELSWFVDDTLTKAIFSVPGVGNVSRIGGIDREVRIDLKPAALQAYGVTAGTITQQLARLQVDRPGGRATVGGTEQSVRTIATVASPRDLEDFPIYLPDGRTVRLSALATVADGAATPQSAALLDGKPGVAVSIQRVQGSSEVATGEAVREKVREVMAAHPDIRFVEVTSSIEDAKASYDSSMWMLLEGAILAVIVVFLFLRDWRATWISAIALPLSIIPTFAVMSFFGFSLNLLSLLALAVVIGILVDDAIVEVENVARHRAMGKSPMQAAVDASQEIGTAVIATSATLAAVFVPVAFMPGITGKFFREFGWTAAAAVLFSLLVARLLTPMMAAYYMKGEPKPVPQSGLMTWYLGWVERAIEHRRAALAIAAGTFIASLALVPLIPKTFLPASDPSRTRLLLELPPGARLEDTIAAAEAVRRRFEAVPEVRSVFAQVGGETGGGHGGGIDSAQVRRAVLTVQLAKDRDRVLHEIESDARQRIADLPGVRFVFQAGGGVGAKLELVLSGRDSVQLAETANRVAAGIRGLPGIGSVSSSASLLRPEIFIRPDPARAAEFGVSTVDIADAVRVATTGDFEQRLPRLNLAERQIPIRVQLADAALDQQALIGQLRVPSRNGPIPLSAVASIESGSGPATIERLNRERNVKVEAELNGRPLGDVMAEVNRLEVLQTLPPGVRLLPSGDSEAFVELFVGFVLALFAGVACIYIVLLLLFNRVSQPMTILAAIPLCGGGAFGALLLTGFELSVPSLVGLILLTGIATKNSILIVDYAIIGEREGMSRHDAIVDACRKRARPVIMTTLAMGAGMLPIALGLGADGNFRAPLGVAVIGGLITSTLLSLVVIPAAYVSMARFSDRMRARFGMRRRSDSAPPEDATPTPGPAG